MRNNFFILFLVIIGSVLVSCDRTELTDTSEAKIPIDSLYISFKIDGDTVVIQSPAAIQGFVGWGVTRLHKVQNNAADSIIYGMEYRCWTDDFNYVLTFGFAKSFLIDTVLIENYAIPNLKSELFKTGDGAMLFYPPFDVMNSLTSYNEGFYITISDKRKNVYYKSYVEKSGSYNNLNLYHVFKTNSSFELVSSQHLDAGIYSDYQNAWFIESHFECALFEVDSLNQRISKVAKKITEGVIRGCF